jgi:hypothetical protein
MTLQGGSVNYTSPAIVDYGDVAQLTAAMNNFDSGDFLIQSGQTLGVQNSTGKCQTGFKNVGGVCVPLPPT